MFATIILRLFTCPKTYLLALACPLCRDKIQAYAARKSPQNKEKPPFSGWFPLGTPGAIRTHGLQSRRQDTRLHKMRILCEKYRINGEYSVNNRIRHVFAELLRLFYDCFSDSGRYASKNPTRFDRSFRSRSADRWVYKSRVIFRSECPR